MKGLLISKVLLLIACALAAGLCHAQKYRIGALWPGSERNEAFVQALTEAGYREGANLVIESLYADWQLRRLPALAEELVRRKPDLIFAPTNGAARAALGATRTIPIVFALAPDPVEAGLVASLARPGGNATGTSNIQTGLTAKRLQLLEEAVPGLQRVGAIYDPDDSVSADQMRELQAAARELKLQMHAIQANRLDEYERAFAAFRKLRIGAVFVTGSVASFRQRQAIAELAIHHRLPTMNAAREYVEAGGLVSYGPDLAVLYRQSAGYVDRILKGTRPADLPVQQPDRFETQVNLRTANAIGQQIPRSILLRADRVVE